MHHLPAFLEKFPGEAPRTPRWFLGRFAPSIRLASLDYDFIGSFHHPTFFFDSPQIKFAQPCSRLLMDDITTTTETLVQTSYLLDKLIPKLHWAGLYEKVEKCRALVIIKGEVSSRRIEKAQRRAAEDRSGRKSLLP